METDIHEKMEINGVKQFVSVRGKNENLPLLLYLHGGPGDAALPLVHKYNRDLENDFNVIVWEQRGAGKSYYAFDVSSGICIDTFVRDACTLVKLLLERFRQTRVFVVGHSWGSVLGLMLLKQYPQLVQVYIGCGQVVDMQKSSKIAYDFALSHAAGKDRDRLLQIDCSYTGERWLDDLLFVTKQVVKHKGSLYGASNYNRFVADFLFSGEYSIAVLIKRQKGAMQAIQYLWQELMKVSFEDSVSFERPVVLIEGKYDCHVCSNLAKEYFDTIVTEKQFFLFEHSCHFPQWSEPDRFNRTVAGIAGKIAGAARAPGPSA